MLRRFQPAAGEERADGGDRRGDPRRCRDGEHVEQTAGDKACKHAAQRRHAEGEALPLGGVIVGDNECDIRHDRGGVQRVGRRLQRLCGE